MDQQAAPQEVTEQNFVLEMPYGSLLRAAPVGTGRLFDVRLPIPSPNIYYDNYHHPLFPRVLPAIHCFADPASHPYAFPQPLGRLPAHRHNVLGATFHDFGYVNNHPETYFTKYMLWFLEIDDYLLHLICPSDLNDVPCEWDELQGGCPMLRLCQVKHKYPHPHLGQIPACQPELLLQCRYLHGIEPTCRSISRQLRLPEEERFRGAQLCEAVAGGRICQFGHDLESARVEAVWRYWEHKEEARLRGSVGVVQRDIWGRKLLRPVRPRE